MALDLALLAAGFNQHTGRYNFARGANGDVAFDATQAYAVNTAVACRKRAYWADRLIGSDLFQLENITSRTPSQAEAMVLDALLPLENANLISAGPTAQAEKDRTPSGGNRLLVDFDWKTPGGQQGSGKVPA